MDITDQSPAILSVCTGMRGLERGLERAIGPIRVAAYVEIEAFAVANLVLQMEQGMVAAAPVWTDLKTFPAHKFYGRIHGIIGSYPCTPYSIMGKLSGSEHDAFLWPYFGRAVRAIKPFFVFSENVRNHLGLGYEQVRRELQGLGYTVKEGIYSAEQAGAPHKRDRLYFLAILDDPTGRRYRKDSEIQTGGGGTALNAGEELGYASVPGLEGFSWDGNDKGKGQAQAGSITETGFPMGQGIGQYDWEEPRIIEPGMGSAVNGYNFRTDLLRMYGNAVVEQTAELAFKDLMKQHFQTV